MATKTTYITEIELGAKRNSSWGELKGATTALDRLDSAATKIGKTILTAGAAVATGVTAAAIQASEVYKGFEQEMANVASISQATASQYVQLKDAALDAGAQTVYTAEESAQALEYMSLAGWDVNKSTKALMPVLKMAAATQKELGTTSDLITDSMGALKLEVEGLSGYMDMLIAANNNSNTSAEQLMQALIKTGGAARTVGADLPDTITALGVLANNGTKAEEAGTAVNSILTRIASNSTAIKTLNKIGVSLYDSEGKFIGLKEALVEINNAIDDMTDEKKAQALAGIAGTRRYSLMTYLLNSVKEDAKTGVSAWDELENKINNSQGSLDKMYATTTDTLEAAEAQLNSVKEDMQIRVTDVFADDQKEFIQWMAGEVPKATDAIVEFAEAHKYEFAEALESTEEIIEKVAIGGLETAAWVIDNKTAVVGALKGIAGGILAIKAAAKVMHMQKTIEEILKLSKSVTTLTSLATIASLAVTAGIAIKGMIDNAEESATAANLAEHFGKISLSLEEIDSLARQIIGEESLEGVSNMLQATADAADSLETTAEGLSGLQKDSWKINAGFAMDIEDYKQYGEDIESYVKNVEQYAEDKGYEVHIATTLLFGEGSSQDIEASSFFRETEAQLEKYGKELHDYLYDEVNGALADGVIDIDEDKIVQEYLQKMNKITQAISDAENESKFDALKLKYSGKDLDAESIKQLQEDLGKYTEETADGAQKAYEAAMSSYRARFELDDSYSKEDFNKDSTEAEKSYHDLIANAASNAGTYMIDTISEAYPQLEAGLQQYEQDLADIIENYIDTSNINIQTDWKTNPTLVLQNMNQEALNAVKENLGEDDRKAILEYLENMQPTMEELGDVVQWYEETGQEIPDELKNIQDTWQKMNSLADPNIDTASIDMGDELSVSDDFKDFVEEAGIEIDKSYVQVGDKIDDKYSKGYDVDTDVRLKINVRTETNEVISVADAVTDAIGAAQKMYDLTVTAKSNSGSNAKVASNAEGGIYDTPLLTTFAEEGPEAAIPIDGTPRAKSLWMKTGQMLGMIGETRDQRLLRSLSSDDKQVVNNQNQETREIKLVYNPSIVIKGNATKDDVQKALSINKEQLIAMLKEITAQDNRVLFGGRG